MILAISTLLVPLRAGPIVTVGTQLSLVIDVSGSITDVDYDLQRQAYAASFNSSAIQNLIINSGGLVVNVVQFGTSAHATYGWTLLTDAASASNFATMMSTMVRSESGRTDIIDGINMAYLSFANSGYDATKKVIDVSGDGYQNQQSCTTSDTICALLQSTRDTISGAGITINGLAILSGDPSLETYYNDNLKSPGGFVEVAADFASFQTAIDLKLAREVNNVPADVPEPSTVVLLGAGLAAMAGWKLRR